MPEPLKILYLCTANSCRSQMAEGWTRAVHRGRIEAYSAGTKPDAVNQIAILVMKEAGIDISAHRSKAVSEFYGQKFDYVVTLCGSAKEECPFFPGAGKMVHAGFPDPAAATGSKDEILSEFRRVRDLIRAFVEGLPESISIQQRKADGIE